MTSQQDLDSMLNQMAVILKPVVDHIEASTPTTKDHYGEYMSAIQVVVERLGESERKPATYLGVAVAFQRAGANKNGLHSALRVMGYL